MGKPFASELEQIGSTLDWVLSLDASILGASPATTGTLATVGSGGSQSAAIFASMLHRSVGGVAFATTPLEFISMTKTARQPCVLLISASGANKDILAAANAAVASESVYIRSVTTNSGSPLSALLTQCPVGHATDLALPTGKDGFLATNSLIGTMAALHRIYALSNTELGNVAATLNDSSALLEDVTDDLLDRPEWIVAHAGWGAPAAFDLESKLSEAALRTVQLTDLRNFAHGRHLWLAKRPRSTGVVILVDKSFEDLARSTARLIPSSVPCGIIRAGLGGSAGAIELTCRTMDVVERVGKLSGIDPGRPGVPPFGRRIYHLGPRGAAVPTQVPIGARAAARKETGSPITHASKATVAAATGFIERLSATRFASVVLDFDGTLVDPSERWIGIRRALCQRLDELLLAGIGIAIATGRGQSVRERLREAISERHWDRVLVGYYNGAEIITLSDDKLPDRQAAAEGPLAEASERLRLFPGLAGRIKLELRPQQLTVEADDGGSWGGLCQPIRETLLVEFFESLKILESSHSIDVLPVGISKLAVVRKCTEAFGGPALCVGDRGAWPGNDCELLSSPFSLSVDSVSSSLQTCWNLLPVGVRGASGTLHYMDAARTAKGTLELRGLK